MGWYIFGFVIAIVLSMAGFALIAPRVFVRALIRPLLSLLYRKHVVGLENLPAEGGYLIVGNHVSWIDGAVLLWMLPRNVRFVVDGGNFATPFTKWVAAAFGTILMLTNPKSIARALKTAREGLKAGDVIGIFPEGTLTRTGQLQGFKPGFRKILQGNDAPIVPFYLDGMWGSIFSFSGGKFFLKWPNKFRRRLTLYIGKPLEHETPTEIVRSQVAQLAARAQVEHRSEFPLLSKSLIRAWRRRGSRLQIADSMGTELKGRDALTRALALRRMLAREVFSKDEQNIGILLPPSAGGVVVNVALAFDRRVAVNLNYTVSSEVINYCIKEVGIKHVLTSERFLSKIGLEIDSDVITLESVRDKVSTADKAIAFLQANLVPARMLFKILGLNRVKIDDLLTIIFTSGSTGMPKGVMLTQGNISHNVDAIEKAIRLNDDDVVLGVLPFFHSFGYSVTLWAAQVLGPCGVYHFNPLDAKQVGKLSQKYGVTVILGTPTFVRGYIRRVAPEQFAKLDICVVGAEKMPGELFEAFEEKFGVRPVEGYGTTELSPLVSVNVPPTRSPSVHQPDRIEGSVGRPLPGVCAKVVSQDTGEEMKADEDGMLLIAGPNVMAGYANRDDLTGKAIQDGFYITGDVAHIDGQGFIHITGRLSRFSKIGGEMVPHVKVEEEICNVIGRVGGGEEAADADEGAMHVCVTAVPDSKKGERLIVLHRPLAVDTEAILAGLKEAGLPNLFIPGRDSFYEVDAIPLLGTGKLDLKGAKDLALELTGSTGAS
ncbi:AMP-binding protein [Rhodopirellula sp. MGV]|uniref:AMP-binding protein n=1 Tax=Rhodopirellula sp. MGV TaxID=2023130 RepID=UPI000B96C4A0|nr:AMP-binding protein [Rhodopirellula sp. MGV]OYP37332.1 acyl-[ACP]--phospholipid O-acyltransferase [Rhodopirellula sp. MGV]PNY36421.1 acyl-[ACP]--phospholipid O-acyltransferase [Rhodopirellula baltica]